MKKIFLLLVFIAFLHGKDNGMTIYGTVNADMDVFFRVMYYAKNAKDSIVEDGLKRELSEKEGCYSKSSGSYTAPATYHRPKIRLIDSKVDIEDGTYKMKIPSIAPDIDNCKYTLHNIRFLIGKKYYGIDDQNINSFDIYKYDGSIDHSLYFFEIPPKRQYRVVADENICEATFYADKESRIEAKIRAIKGSNRIVNPIEKNLSIKIDIVLKNKNKYNPNEFYDNQTFFEKLKNRIFG